MEMTTRASGTKRRRGAAFVASLAFAATGIGWAGCGDEDQAQEAIDDAQDQAEETLDEVNESVDEGDVDAALEEAQDEADKALEDAQQQLEDAGY